MHSLRKYESMRWMGLGKVYHRSSLQGSGSLARRKRSALMARITRSSPLCLKLPKRTSKLQVSAPLCLSAGPLDRPTWQDSPHLISPPPKWVCECPSLLTLQEKQLYSFTVLQNVVCKPHSSRITGTQELGTKAQPRLLHVPVGHRILTKSPGEPHAWKCLGSPAGHHQPQPPRRLEAPAAHTHRRGLPSLNYLPPPLSHRCFPHVPSKHRHRTEKRRPRRFQLIGRSELFRMR